MNRRNVNINHIEFEFDTIDSIWEIFNKKISLEEKGYSLQELELHEEENVITGKIVKRHSTYIRDYDYSLQQFEEKRIFLFNEICFGIDFSQNLLYSFGASANFNSVKVVLRQILSNYQIRAINLTIVEFVKRIIKQGFVFKAEEIAINKFSYENSIVGKFIGHVKNTEKAVQLLEKYGSDVYRLSISLHSKRVEEFSLVITNVNAFRIQGEEDSFDENFNIIKQILE